jgi:succinoglycan biosynthesis transport protein ExoP
LNQRPSRDASWSRPEAPAGDNAALPAPVAAQNGRSIPATPSFDQSEGGLPDLRYYAHLLLHHKWAILFCVVVFAACGALTLRKAVPVYAAFSTVKYEPRGYVHQNFGNISSYYLYGIDEMQTAVELIRSPRIARAVIDSLGLYAAQPAPSAEDSSSAAADKSKPTESLLSNIMTPVNKFRAAINRTRTQLARKLVDFPEVKVDPEILRDQGRVRGILGQVAVQQREGTNLLDIRIYDSNPVQAARLADEFANQFIGSLAQERTQRFGYAREKLSQEIEEKKREFEEADRARHEFNVNSELKAIRETREVMKDELVALTKDIERTQNEVAILEARKEAADQPAIRKALLTEDPYYSALGKKLNDLEIERISLAAESKPDFPPLRKLDLQIQTIRDQLVSATEDIKLDIGGRLEMERIRLTHMKKRLAEQSTKFEAIEGRMFEYRLLEGNSELAKDLFESLLEQFKRLDSADDDMARGATLISPANIPTTPISPKISSTLTRYSFMGLALGVALAFLLAWLDRSVKNPAAVEERLKVPTLGLVPYLATRSRFQRLWQNGSKKTPRAMLMFGAGKNAKGEGPETFRYLRTSLMYSSEKTASKILLVTSTLPSEGKTTVSTNLAACMAERGEKVLIIDADLRRPAVHKAFDIVRMPGLSDVLAGQKEFDQAVVHLEDLGLDVLPAGENSPSPLNLLDSVSMENLLIELRERYSTIIIDSAPCYALADSLVLATMANGVCLVVEQGRTRIDALRETVEKLRGIGAEVLGAVYNVTRVKRLGSYGYYAYGYYSYGYYRYSYGYKYGGYGADQRREDSATIAADRKIVAAQAAAANSGGVKSSSDETPAGRNPLS